MKVLSFHNLGEDSYLLNVCISPSLFHLSLFEDGINQMDFWSQLKENTMKCIWTKKGNLLALIKWQDWIQGPENIIRTWFLSISLLCRLSYWLQFPASHGSKRLPRAPTSERSQVSGLAEKCTSFSWKLQKKLCLSFMWVTCQNLDQQVWLTGKTQGLFPSSVLCIRDIRVVDTTGLMPFYQVRITHEARSNFSPLKNNDISNTLCFDTWKSLRTLPSSGQSILSSIHLILFMF